MKSRTYLDTGAGNKRSPAAAYRNVLLHFTLEPGPQVGKALRGLDAQIDSEQFRSTPRTCQPFRGRLRVLKIERIGPCRLLVHRWDRHKARGGGPMFDMRRCEFIPLLGGAAVYPPLAARVQRPERVVRIVFLPALAENEPEAQAPAVAFRQGLEALPPSCAVTGDNLPRAAL